MSPDQPRMPAGSLNNSGGRFAPERHDEPVTTLGPERGCETRTPFPGLIELTPATVRVLDAITRNGGHPYLVGGCVRDAILEPGRIPTDVAIEAFGVDIDTLTSALRTVGHVDEVGREFSVLKIRVQREDFDVALPRRDSKSGSGHRGFDVVADPSCTLVDATGRRDFTLNALMFDPATGDVVDCWGGLADLRAGVLRHTTDAFSDDPLRVLRAVQFAARFGFTIDDQTATMCQSLAGSFTELSPERVWTEWRKIGSQGRHLSAALAVLAQTGWERHFEAIADLHGVPQDPSWHPEGDVHAHSGLAGDKGAQLADSAGLVGDDRTVVVLASLLHDVGKVTHTQVADGRVTSSGHDHAGVEPARCFLATIDATREVRDRILPLVREHMSATTAQTPSRAAVRRLARRLAPATIDEWALVVAADKGGRGAGSTAPGTEAWLELARQMGTQQAPARPILRGEHLIAAGMKPGPAFAPIMKAALAAQDDELFTDEVGAIDWLAAHLRR
jgi:tRNA nucleotidyltransferase (CCA-adding enzyme)